MGAVLHEAMRSLQSHEDGLSVSQPEQLASEGGVLHYGSAARPHEQPVLQAICRQSEVKQS